MIKAEEKKPKQAKFARECLTTPIPNQPENAQYRIAHYVQFEAKSRRNGTPFLGFSTKKWT